MIELRLKQCSMFYMEIYHKSFIKRLLIRDSLSQRPPAKSRGPLVMFKAQ